MILVNFSGLYVSLLKLIDNYLHCQPGTQQEYRWSTLNTTCGELRLLGVRNAFEIALMQTGRQHVWNAVYCGCPWPWKMRGLIGLLISKALLTEKYQMRNTVVTLSHAFSCSTVRQETRAAYSRGWGFLFCEYHTWRVPLEVFGFVSLLTYITHAVSQRRTERKKRLNHVKLELSAPSLIFRAWNIGVPSEPPLQ